MSDEMKQMMMKMMQQLQEQQLMINNLTKQLAEQKSKNNSTHTHIINPIYYSLPPFSNIPMHAPIITTKIVQKIEEKNKNNSNIQLIKKQKVAKWQGQINQYNQSKREEKEKKPPRQDKNPREVKPSQQDRYNMEKKESKKERPKQDRSKKEEKQDKPPRNDKPKEEKANINDRQDRPHRNQKHRRNNRNDMIREGNDRPRRMPIQWTKIGAIEPGDENLNILAQVISAEPHPNGKTIRVVLGDETGIVKSFLRNHQYLVVGKSIVLFEAWARVFKEHIEIQLMERGKVDEARHEVREINKANDISAKQWVEQS